MFGKLFVLLLVYYIGIGRFKCCFLINDFKRIVVINIFVIFRKNKVIWMGFIFLFYIVGKLVKIFGRKDFRFWIIGRG